MSITAVLIDQREPSWVQSLKFEGAIVASTILEYGDALVTCDDQALLAIERKTPDDLLNSLRDNRLWSQLAGIRKVTPWAYLLITGELRQGLDGKVITDARGTGWNWASIQGALLRVQEMGVFVVQCAGDDDYEAAVLRLAARSHKPELVIPPAREPIPMSTAERILLALPGLGPERVQVLLERCGTPAWALMCLTDLSINDEIPDIGIGIKRGVRKALGLDDDMILAPYIAETQPQAKEQVA